MKIPIPNKPIAAILFGLWWVAQPLNEAVFHTIELRRGAYPTDADSIGIPIFGFAISWIVITPVVAWVTWRSLRRAPRRAPWLAFDRRRLGASVAWTLALTIVALGELQTGVLSVGTHHPEGVASGFLGFASAMYLRAIVCAPKLDSQVESERAV